MLILFTDKLHLHLPDDGIYEERLVIWNIVREKSY
jgi:hypothetical protein